MRLLPLCPDFEWFSLIVLVFIVFIRLLDFERYILGVYVSFDNEMQRFVRQPYVPLCNWVDKNFYLNVCHVHYFKIVDEYFQSPYYIFMST